MCSYWIGNIRRFLKFLKGPVKSRRVCHYPVQCKADMPGQLGEKSANCNHY